MGGYTGKILEVNLKTREVKISTVEKEIQRKFIGGSGLAAKLFLDRGQAEVEPFSAGNTLFVMTGPLTGTTLPGTSRFVVCAKSPLTGIWGEGACGGNFGSELKFAGWDGIIIEDVSDKPVYLFIDNEKVELRDARDLWGKDTYEVTDILKENLAGQKKVKVLSIGQAGENLVKYANIANDKSNFIGRCGLGAVMGFKKLKAICVRGSGKVEVALPEEYAKLRKEIIEKCKESAIAASLHSMGTASSMDLGPMSGDVPFKNWSMGEDFDLAAQVSGTTMREKYLIGTKACYACPIACKREVKVAEGPYQTEKGPGPEYETCAVFGTMMLNKDLAAIIKANEKCNKYGLDTISCGSAIAFAMDCFEHQLITTADTDGLDLSWGNMDAVLKLIDKIASREGFGNLLAEGTRNAAAKIGKNASDWTVEVKGLDLPMHDPRAYHGMGLAYMMSSRGGCHLQHLNLPIEQGQAIYPEIGLKEDYEGPTSEGKAEMTVLSENLGVPCNSAVICEFLVYCMPANNLVEMLKFTTGFDWTLEELLKCGERIWLLKRGLINLMGVRAKDDRLPRKVLTPKDGMAAGSVPDINLMLKEYYQLRDLNEDGIPKREKLETVGLEDLAKRLY